MSALERIERTTMTESGAGESVSSASPELSASALLALAAREAARALKAGVIVGPSVDEMALRRAERRARRADAADFRCVLVEEGVAS